MLKWIGIALGMIVLGIGALLYLFFSGVHTEQQAFDVGAWKELHSSATMNDPGCVRGGMALDLIRSKTLVGLNRDELLVKLGVPDTSERDLLTFALGQCQWDWKHNELVVQIGMSGQSMKAFIRTTPFETPVYPPNTALQRDAPQAARP